MDMILYGKRKKEERDRLSREIKKEQRIGFSWHVGKAEGRAVLRFLPYKSPHLYLLGCGIVSHLHIDHFLVALHTGRSLFISDLTINFPFDINLKGSAEEN